MRPMIPGDACEPALLRIMQDCWAEDPMERPTFEQLRVKLRPLVKYHTGNLFNNIVKRLENYAIQMEIAVQERTAAFVEEKKKSEELLNQILPKYCLKLFFLTETVKRWQSIRQNVTCN